MGELADQVPEAVRNSGSTGILRNWGPGRITISVAPGICSGNFETQPTGQTTRPPELLPLVLNTNVVPTAPAILTFSYIDVYNAATGVPDPSLVLEYSYLRNSRLNFVDEDGLLSQPGVIRDDLRLSDPFDGAALLNQTRIRH